MKSMGAEQSKNLENAQSIPDVLPDVIGCDAKGTVLCPEGDATLTCLNGGVCALFVKEVEDTCEKRCRCNPDYFGDHCEYYNGFFTATVGLMVGCLLAIILTVFLIILIWYCCTHKSRRNDSIEQADSTNRSNQRVPLATQLTNQLKRGGATESNWMQMESNEPHFHYPVEPNLRTSQIQKSSTSRSYSVYDNVPTDLEQITYMDEFPQSQCTVGPDGTRETAHLLAYDSVDYGVDYGLRGGHECETANMTMHHQNVQLHSQSPLGDPIQSQTFDSEYPGSPSGRR
ncbi:hypothetical protein EG68_02395 [Paragonimus skrjabini miyazakii]|uniref:EGF-like domain-containing protein n=1 Tax=Paragonimus skrjabini miyazakii TaxID=59628 RepID=A0A8S9Z0N2_9TREM|nr:hypothetical protein EG68_02395 [Paragonimus skrjabini miyazakii]